MHCWNLRTLWSFCHQCIERWCMWITLHQRLSLWKNTNNSLLFSQLIWEIHWDVRPVFSNDFFNPLSNVFFFFFMVNNIGKLGTWIYSRVTEPSYLKTFSSALGNFAVGNFAVGYFAVRNFCHKISSPYGNFAVWKFFRKRFLSFTIFLYMLTVTINRCHRFILPFNHPIKFLNQRLNYDCRSASLSYKIYVVKFSFHLTFFNKAPN